MFDCWFIVDDDVVVILSQLAYLNPFFPYDIQLLE